MKADFTPCIKCVLAPKVSCLESWDLSKSSICYPTFGTYMYSALLRATQGPQNIYTRYNTVALLFAL